MWRFELLPSHILERLQYLHVLLCQLLDLLQQHCILGFYLVFGCFALKFPTTGFDLVLLRRHLLCFLRLPLLLTRFPFALLELGLASVIVAIQSVLKLLALLLVVRLPFFNFLKRVDALRKLILNRVHAVEDLLPSKVHIVAYDVALVLQVRKLANHVQMSHLLPYIATCCFEDGEEFVKFGPVSR